MKEILLDRNLLRGATKLMDGFYFGDILASQDLQFLNDNKISHVVNTSIELPNKYESVGIKYHNLDWRKEQKDSLFISYNQFNEFFKFVNSAIKKQKGVLVMSLFGRNRVFVACVLYIIRKFRWSLNMTISLLNSKYPQNGKKVLKKKFKEQIKFWVKELSFYNLGPKTYQFGNPSDPDNKDEVLLMHTYLNSKQDLNNSKMAQKTEEIHTEEEEKVPTKPNSGKGVNWADSPNLSQKNRQNKQSDALPEVKSSENQDVLDK